MFEKRVYGEIEDFWNAEKKEVFELAESLVKL